MNKTQHLWLIFISGFLAGAGKLLAIMSSIPLVFVPFADGPEERFDLVYLALGFLGVAAAIYCVSVVFDHFLKKVDHSS